MGLRERRRRSAELLERVGLADLDGLLPAQQELEANGPTGKVKRGQNRVDNLPVPAIISP
jgi:hypothetical protein